MRPRCCCCCCLQLVTMSNWAERRLPPLPTHWPPRTRPLPDTHHSHPKLLTHDSCIPRRALAAVTAALPQSTPMSASSSSGPPMSLDHPATPPSCSRSLIVHALVDTLRTRDDISMVEMQEQHDLQLEPISAASGDNHADHCDAGLPSPSVADSAARADHEITPPRSDTPTVIIHEFDVYATAARADSAHDSAGSTVQQSTDGTDGAAPQTASSAPSALAAATPALRAASAAAAPPPAPNAAQWREELRSMWEAGAEAAANAAAAKRKQQAQQLQAAQSRQERLPLSAAVQAQPPLQGDIVWHAKPARRVTVGAHEPFECECAHGACASPSDRLSHSVVLPLCRSSTLHRCPNTKTSFVHRSYRTGVSIV